VFFDANLNFAQGFVWWFHGDLMFLSSDFVWWFDWESLFNDENWH
jgi:hypothetical protein